MGVKSEHGDKPMHRLAQACAAPRCGARTRSATPCRSAAMPNGRCRMHGGASPGAPSGPANGMWRHGLRSAEVIERHRSATARARTMRQAIEGLSRRAAREH